MRTAKLVKSFVICLLLLGSTISHAQAGHAADDVVDASAEIESEFPVPSELLELGYYFVRDGKYAISSFNVNAWGEERYFTTKIRYKVYYRDQYGQIRLASKYAHLQGEILKIGPNLFQSDTSYTSIGADICEIPIRLTFRKTTMGFQLKIYQPRKYGRGCVVESFQTVRIEEEYLRNSLRGE